MIRIALVARDGATDARAFARAAQLLGRMPTQGKCDRCRRFYYFRGPGRFGSIWARTCPECRAPLSRTSAQSLLRRYTISRSGTASPLTRDELGPPTDLADLAVRADLDRAIRKTFGE